MKNFRILLLMITIIGVISCTSTTVVTTTHKSTSNPSGKVPPGQMKKATGAKSAKQYAPGQQKKKNKK